MGSEASGTHFIRAGALSLAVICALASSQAQAVGLGAIEVKSKLDQPFYAEIPLTINGPGEADDLVVRLASAEAFARVGMDPNELSANLQFTVTKNARGEPIVRVTTPQRLSDPYVTFLVEADWGNGKMVREYTALLDPPRTVSVQHLGISAPVVAATPLPAPPPSVTPAVAATLAPVAAASTPPPVAPSQTVDLAPRATTDAMPELTAPAQIAAAPEPEPAPEPMPAPAASAPEPTPIAPEPTPIAESPPPTPIPEPSPEQEAPKPASDAITVNHGDTLSKIAGQMRPNDVSINRMMIALQRANPDAFVGGNINLLKSGAVLHMPSSDQSQAITAAEANALVHAQVESWRQGAQPAPQLQPEETADNQIAKPGRSTATAAGDRSSASTATGNAANRTSAAPRPDGTAVSITSASKRRGAHLEIVPPAGNGSANSQTGASEGGSGSELRTELAQTREELSARNAEVSDLKSRVADLEKIKTDSQKLLNMKDSELAAMQQRLAELEKNNAATPAPVASSPVATSSSSSATTLAPAPSSSIVSPTAAANASTAAAVTASPAPPKVVAAAVKKPAVQPLQPVEEPTPWYLQPFILAGAALIGFAALLGFMLRRPRRPEPAPRSRSFHTSALAASMAPPGADAGGRIDEPVHVRTEPDIAPSTIIPTAAVPPAVVPPEVIPVEVIAPAAAERAVVLTPEPAAPLPTVGDAPKRAEGDDDWAIPDRIPANAPAPAAPAATVVRPAMPAAHDSRQSVADKLNLARAYIDVGDADSARSMLEQVLIEGNAALQDEAFKLLDTLDS